MTLRIALASSGDAPVLARLRREVAVDLTSRFGQGHWSNESSERGVLRSLTSARVLMLLDGLELIGSLSLSSRKPWAIDAGYFTRVTKPLYLTDMAVVPSRQGQGCGRILVQAAEEFARRHPARGIRLDAYDSPAGAGGFYSSCGYQERGRVAFRGVPLIYYELLLDCHPSGAS